MRATHAASKRGKNGAHTVHAVILLPNVRVAVPLCNSHRFHWDTLHDAVDKHTGLLSAHAAVLSSWGCKRCQAGLTNGRFTFDAPTGKSVDLMLVDGVTL